MKLPIAFLTLLMPAAVRAQTVTVFTNRAAFEAAMGNFKVVDDFSLGGTFLDVTTNNGAINGAAKWADIARDPEPSTIWAVPFGTMAFGGTWDNTVAGVGGGLAFDLDFGSGNIVTVPGSVPGNAPANTFFGFIASHPFFNVRERQFDSVGNTLQETHTLDDLTVQVAADWQDVRFLQAGAGAWDTAGHWDPAAVPGANQRAFITPVAGAVVSGPAAAASVRQLAIGNGTAASRLNLVAAGTLTVARSALVQASSTLGGEGRLMGALTVATGGTLTVADGQTLQVGSAAANGFAGSGTITVGTGALILEDTGATPLGTLTTLGGGTLTALGGTAQIGSGKTLRGNGALTGAFELLTGGTLRAQSGTLQVAQLAATDGTAAVDAARTLSIGGTNTIGFATTTIGAGGTLTTDGTLQLIVASTLGAGATVRGGLGLQFSGAVSHAGAQVFDAGTGDLLMNQLALTADATDSLLGARLVMTGPLATFSFSNDASLGTAGNQIVLNGGRLFPQTNLTLPPGRSVEVTALNGSVIAPAGWSLGVEGNISGAGRLTLTGSSGGVIGGTVRLAGNNSHAGGTDIAGVTLEIASDVNLGGPAGVMFLGRESGLNNIPGRLRALGNLDIATTRSTTFRIAAVDTNGFDVTFNQPIAGLDLNKEGAGVLRLNTKNANDNSHDVRLFGGTLRIAVNDALGLGARVSTTAGAVFDLNGFNHEVLNVNGDGDILLGAGTLTTRGTSSIGGIISGTGGVAMKFNGGRLLGDNTFTGGLTVRDGAVVSVKSTAGFGGAGNSVLLDNGGISSDSEATAPVVIGATFPMTIGAGGATFGASGQPLIIEALLAGANPLRVRGGGAGFEVRFAPYSPLSPGTSVSKKGPGALVIAGISQVTTFSVDQGTLQLDNNSATDTIGISLNGGTLTGSGRAIRITSGAGSNTISPATGNGTAILETTRLNLNSATRVELDLNGTTAGTGHDRIDAAASAVDSSGTVTLNGATLFVRQTTPHAIGTSFTIINNDGTDAIGGTFGGRSEGSNVRSNLNQFTISYIGGTGNDVVLTVVAPTVSDFARTWDGGGGADNDWTTAANWVSDIVPQIGDSLVFPASVHVSSTSDSRRRAPRWCAGSPPECEGHRR